MTSGPIVSMWIGLPLGVVMMLFVAGHLIVLSEITLPPSRRRIRQANGGLMLVLIPLLTAGFSLIDPTIEPRLWVLVWMAALPMLWFVLMLAAVDMLNTWRLTRRRRAKLRDELRTIEAMTEHVLRDLRHTPRPDRAGDAGG